MNTNIESILRRRYIKECYQNIIQIINKWEFGNVVIKGEALSKQAYGKEGQRVSTDVDILVSRENLKKAEAVLRDNGFEDTEKSRDENIMLLLSSHQVSPWIKNIHPWGHVIIDLNFDIFWGEYEGKRIDIDKFLCDAVEMDIYGVKVKTLPPIKALIQLVLHHYKDMNSIFLLSTRKSIRYEMFRDVYYLLKNNLDTITIEKLHKMSEEYEIIPYVLYVLYYTGQVFKDEELKGYIEAFRTPKGEALLNCYGLCAKERKEWRYGFDARLAADNLYELIKDDLTEKDFKKISVNKHVFMGIDE